MNNIKLNYLYRDGGNYKQFGYVIFSNPNRVDIKIIGAIINESLIDGEFFIAEKWEVPSLFFEVQNEDDHAWHEFESIEITNESPNTALAIEDFISTLEKVLPTANRSSVY